VLVMLRLRRSKAKDRDGAVVRVVVVAVIVVVPLAGPTLARLARIGLQSNARRDGQIVS